MVLVLLCSRYLAGSRAELSGGRWPLAAEFRFWPLNHDGASSWVGEAVCPDCVLVRLLVCFLIRRCQIDGRHHI